MRLADPDPLTAIATLDGSSTLRLHGRESNDTVGATTHTLGSGDIALIKGGDYTLADTSTTPCQVIIRCGKKTVLGEAGDAIVQQMTAPRTYGESRPGATTVLHAIYQLDGSAGDRLLDLLPTLTVVPAGPRTGPALEMLAAESARDEPGQDAVLNRLLELTLIMALRVWGSTIEYGAPRWLQALTEPAIGEALVVLHANPQSRWTTAKLASSVGMSRAAFSARFTKAVGEPPMAYLTGWRMTLAADALRETNATIAAVARQVGYENPFAFSAAFKRRHGHSPTTWRCLMSEASTIS